MLRVETLLAKRDQEVQMFRAVNYCWLSELPSAASCVAILFTESVFAADAIDLYTGHHQVAKMNLSLGLIAS